MVGDKVSRRGFMQKAGTLAATTAAVYSWEEENLLARQQRQGQPPGAPQMGFEGGQRGAQPVPDVPGPMPMGKLGNLQVTRLIAGHNLVVGQAHSRDLLWTSQLLRAYFTEEKILETFAMYEKKGINTSLARMSAQMIDPVKKYMKAGGKLQWIAGISAQQDGNIQRDLDMALDMGAKGGYVHGNTSDALFKAKNVDAIGKAVENMKKAGLVAGVCSHLLDVPIACEKAGIKPDFYLKTFNSGNYWSAGPPKEPDPKWRPTETELAQAELGAWGTRNNLWDTTPKQTAAFMASVKVPWIGFKVLAAGALSPREAFKYSFQNGCDFVAVGMYDFQVADGANITKQLLVVNKDTLGRTRPWLA
jgi:hypothetical protein